MNQFLAVTVHSGGDPNFGFLIIGIFIAAIGLGAYFDFKRRKDLENAAKWLGFSYSRNPVEDLVGILGGFNLFKRGHSRTAGNVIQGVFNNIPLTVFDYRYTVGSGKNSSTHRQTVIYAFVPGVNFPGFLMERENFFHKIGEAFGYRDIDFKDHPVFSKKYLLKSADEEAVRRLFAAELLRFFEAKEKTVTVEAQADKIIIYYYDILMRPEALQATLNETGEIFGLFLAGYAALQKD